MVPRVEGSNPFLHPKQAVSSEAAFFVVVAFSMACRGVAFAFFDCRNMAMSAFVSPCQRRYRKSIVKFQLWISVTTCRTLSFRKDIAKFQPLTGFCCTQLQVLPMFHVVLLQLAKNLLVPRC